MFDSDLDFKNNRVRLWKPGTIAEIAASDGLVEVPAAVLNESGGASPEHTVTLQLLHCPRKHLKDTCAGKCRPYFARKTAVSSILCTDTHVCPSWHSRVRV